MNKISWIGTAASIVGSFVVAMQFFVAGYCFFMVGSVSWLIVGISRREIPLIALNGAFFVANIIGFYNSI